MASAYTPNVQYLTVTDAVSTLTYTVTPGSIAIQNIGSNPAWFRYDGTAPTASDATDTDYLGAGSSFAWNNIDIAAPTLKAICAAAQTTKLQVRYTTGKQVG